MDATVDYGNAKRKDARSIDELVRLALTEQDENAAWEAVTVLHFKGNREVLESAARLCAGIDARERELGAAILGQLGVPDRTFPRECFDILAEMLDRESDPSVLESIGIAFGHLCDPGAISLLLPFLSHSDSEVRFGVVMGLTGHAQPDAIAGLIKLSGDSDADVRDWATFAIGSQIETDTRQFGD
jgi:HEAT repeat protein